MFHLKLLKKNWQSIKNDWLWKKEKFITILLDFISFSSFLKRTVWLWFSFVYKDYSWIKLCYSFDDFDIYFPI